MKNQTRVTMRIALIGGIGGFMLTGGILALSMNNFKIDMSEGTTLVSIILICFGLGSLILSFVGAWTFKKMAKTLDSERNDSYDFSKMNFRRRTDKN